MESRGRAYRNFSNQNASVSRRSKHQTLTQRFGPFPCVSSQPAHIDPATGRRSFRHYPPQPDWAARRNKRLSPAIYMAFWGSVSKPGLAAKFASRFASELLSTG